MIDKSILKELKEELEKCTPGEWAWDEPANWIGLSARVFCREPYGVVAQVPVEAWRPKSIGRGNANFIVLAKNHMLSLLNSYEEMEKELSAMDADVVTLHRARKEAESSRDQLKQTVRTLADALRIATTCRTCEGTGEMDYECMACLSGMPGKCECGKEQCAECDGRKWSLPTSDESKISKVYAALSDPIVKQIVEEK